MSVETFFNHPEGIIIPRDALMVSRKITDIATDGADSLCVISDFDHTVSQGGPDDPSTWEAMDNLLPLDGQKKASYLYDKFYPLQKAGELSVAQSVEWLNASIDLYAEYEINKAGIKTAADSIQLRMGAAGFAKDLDNKNVPLILLSGGIKDIIEVVNKRDGVKTNLITATSLRYDEKGVVIGYDEENMVHALNKYERSNAQLEEIRKEPEQEREHVLMLGDELQDMEMAQGNPGHILSIRLGDGRRIENLDAFIKKSFAAKYDMVYIGRSMIPIRKLARGLIGLSVI